jgi:hypothetical protein
MEKFIMSFPVFLTATLQTVPADGFWLRMQRLGEMLQVLLDRIVMKSMNVCELPDEETLTVPL